MTESQLSFEGDVLPVTRTLALRKFRGERQAADLVNDALSLAWEGFLTAGPDVTASNIAWYAVQGVSEGRQFSRSERSLDCPRRRRSQRVDCGPQNFARIDDDPAEVVQVVIDFAAWFASLTAIQQAALIGFLMGERTGDMAEQLGLTAGRVSQLRGLLVESWELFTA